MRILIGTTNPSKIRYFQTLLEGVPVEFVTPKDLGIEGDPDEYGHTPAQNAAIKADFYGQYADTVICADSGLYYDSLPLDDPRQPGLHIRTPQGGKRLDDEEMIAYYTAQAHALGGAVLAYYMDGLALRTKGVTYTFQATREEARAGAFYLLDRECAQRREGWPLDSISMDTDKVSFLDPQRGCIPQMKWAYRRRLRAFLLEHLGFEQEEEM